MLFYLVLFMIPVAILLELTKIKLLLFPKRIIGSGPEYAGKTLIWRLIPETWFGKLERKLRLKIACLTEGEVQTRPLHERYLTKLAKANNRIEDLEEQLKLKAQSEQ